MRQASETSNTRISRLRAALPCTLDDLAVLALEGPDAVAFAHAQFASDVAALAPGHWHWSCLLSAPGRVLGFGPLLRPDAERLLWIVPDTRVDELVAALRRFVLRRRLLVTAAPIGVSGTADVPPAEAVRAGGPLAVVEGGLRLELGGLGGRSLGLGLARPASRAGVAAWRVLDVLDALPRLEGAAVDAWTAHALGLQRFAAFSTSKGCYPGQEIVARTHFLGRNKRQPRIGWLEDAPPAGDRLLAVDAEDGAEAMGEVVSAARMPDDGVAVLAVVRDDAPVRLRRAGSGASTDFEAPATLAPATQK